MASESSFRKQLKIFRTLSLLLVGLVLIGVLLIFLGYMEDAVDGRGSFAGHREYELKSAVQSRIRTIHKRNGETVKKGELLLELEDRELMTKIEVLRNQIQELKADIGVKEYQLATKKIDPLPKEYRHTIVSLDESRLREKKSKFEFETYKRLHEKGAVSLFELQKKEIEYDKNVAEMRRNEEDYQKIRGGLAATIVGNAVADLELAKVKLAGRQSELKLLEHYAQEYRFTAPEDGIIAYIPTKLGVYVEPGHTVAVLAAAGAKKFIARIDEKQIYKVQEGQKARIASSQYNYFDYGYFYGKVYAIDEMPETIGGRTYYTVRIFIDTEPKPVRLGSTGQVEIITGRDRIVSVLSGWNK